MTIEQKLQELRRLWKLFPDKRKTIEIQAKVLKLAQKETGDTKRILEHLV